MKAIVRILVGLLVILALVFIIGFFLPKNVTVSSSILINASPEIVFNQVNSATAWNNWSPWLSMDSNMVLTVEGPEKGIGTTYSWESEKFGTGKWTVKLSDEFNAVETELDFGEQGKAKGWWKFTPQNNKTLVTWGIDNENMSYAERYFVVLMKKNMVQTLDKGLNSLKEVCEILRLDRISKVYPFLLKQRMVLTSTDSCITDSTGVLLASLYKIITDHTEKYIIEISGNPFAVYHTGDTTGLIKVEAGLPINKKVYYVPKKIEYKEIPDTKTLIVDHWGIPDTKKAHQALDDYIKKKELKETGFRWEEYLIGPEKTADTSLWHTKVYAPIE